MTSKPYFKYSPDPKLAALAKSWEGTPFHPHMATRGVGVDCVWLAAELYRETGALDVFDPPGYSIDGGHHCDASKVVAWVEASGRFVLVSDAPRAGDLVCFKIGKTIHHVGVMLDESRFSHAVARYGVMVSYLAEAAYGKRLAAVYRPTARSMDETQPIVLPGGMV